MNRSQEFFSLCTPNQRKRQENRKYEIDVEEYQKINDEIVVIKQRAVDFNVSLNKTVEKRDSLFSDFNRLKKSVFTFQSRVRNLKFTDEHLQEIKKSLEIFVVEMMIEMNFLDKIVDKIIKKMNNRETKTNTLDKSLNNKFTSDLNKDSKNINIDNQTENRQVKKQLNKNNEAYKARKTNFNPYNDQQDDHSNNAPNFSSNTKTYSKDQAMIKQRPIQSDPKLRSEQITHQINELGSLLTEISLHTQIQGENLVLIVDKIKKSEKNSILSNQYVKQGYEIVKNRRRSIIIFLSIWTLILIFIFFITRK